jgi:hypothetical protein
VAENHMGKVRETAGRQGADVAQHAREAIGDVGSTTREQVGQVAHEAVGQAKHVARDVRERIAGEAEQQTQKVSAQINRIADELHSMADNSSDDSMAAGALRQVADTGRQAARFLDERGARGLLDSAQDFARRKPGTFLLGAAVAGFLVGRVAKSMGGSDSQSNGARYGAPQPRSGQQPHYGTPAPDAGRYGTPGYTGTSGYAGTSGYTGTPGQTGGYTGQPDYAGTPGYNGQPSQFGAPEPTYGSTDPDALAPQFGAPHGTGEPRNPYGGAPDVRP